MRRLLRSRSFPSRFALLLLAFPLLLLTGNFAQGQSTAVNYNDVVLLVNDSSSQSQEVARYFALRRGIPDRHIFHFLADTTHDFFVDSTTFTHIRFALQNWMRERNLIDSINYIVTTKGCPLIVSVADYDKGSTISGYSAFDAALSLINGADSTLILQPFNSGNLAARQNRFFGSTIRFKRDSDIFPFYMVSRLDGYTVDDVKRMIDSATKPVSRLEGTWLFDLDPTFASNSFKSVHDRTLAAGIRLRDDLDLPVFIDQTSDAVTAQENILWYFTWGPFATGNVGVPPKHKWLPGSIGMVITGLAGQTFNHDTTRKNSLLFAELISEGLTGGVTWSLEPYAFGIPYTEVSTDRYAEGWNLAESFFAATPLAGFRTIVVGDPKMKLAGLMTPEPDILSFKPGYRFEGQTDTGYFRNDNPRPITVTGMSVTDEPNAGNSYPDDFSLALPAPRQFPITVQPDDSLLILITHTPSIYGGVQARAKIDYMLPGGRGNGSSFMSVVGSGKRPGIEVPELIDYGIVPNNGTERRTLHIRNLARYDTLLLNGIAVSGDAAPRFRIVNPPTEALTIVGNTEVAFDIDYVNSASLPFDDARVTLNTNSEPATRRVQLHAGITLSVEENERNPFPITVTPIPASEGITLRYEVPAGTARTRIEIIDMQGRIVAVPFDGRDVEGPQSLHYDGKNLASGVYYCRIETTKKSGEMEAGTAPIILRR